MRPLLSALGRLDSWGLREWFGCGLGVPTVWILFGREREPYELCSHSILQGRVESTLLPAPLTKRPTMIPSSLTVHGVDDPGRGVGQGRDGAGIRAGLLADELVVREALPDGVED